MDVQKQPCHPADALHNGKPKGNVWDKVPVHDVQMKHIPVGDSGRSRTHSEHSASQPPAPLVEGRSGRELQPALEVLHALGDGAAHVPAGIGELGALPALQALRRS